METLELIATVINETEGNIQEKRNSLIDAITDYDKTNTYKKSVKIK